MTATLKTLRLVDTAGWPVSQQAASSRDPGHVPCPFGALPAPACDYRPAPTVRLDRLVALLRRPQGASLRELTAALGWQPSSVRAAIAREVRRRRCYTVASANEPGRGRVWRIVSPG